MYVSFVSVCTDVTQWFWPVWCICVHLPVISVNIVFDIYFCSIVLHCGVHVVFWKPFMSENCLANTVWTWLIMSKSMHFWSEIIFLWICVRVPTNGMCCDKISACRFIVLKSISRFFIGRFWVFISCLRFSLQICGKSGLTSGLISDVVSNSSTGSKSTVVFSWTLVFLSVVLEPNEWVVLSWWNVVLLVYSKQSRSLEQVLRMSLHNRLLWVAFCQTFCQLFSCCFL